MSFRNTDIDLFVAYPCCICRVIISLLGCPRLRAPADIGHRRVSPSTSTTPLSLYRHHKNHSPIYLITRFHISPFPLQVSLVEPQFTLTMTLKRKSSASTASDPDSVKKPRLDAAGERPMTEKEKRKAARMIRNRSSAQA